MSADLSPFRPPSRGSRAVGVVAVVVSVVAHVAFAAAFAVNPELGEKAARWVEVQVVKPKPPAPPPPPPPAPLEPEPPKPKPKPKAPIPIEQTAPDPSPAAPAAPEPKPLRRVQGLSANSFATNGTSGLAVRAGNTTAVAATGKGLDLDAATGPYTTRPAASVAVQPKLKWEPPALDVPAEAKEAKVEGVVELVLDLDAAGKVAKVTVVKDLGYGTGAACADAWRRSQWKPAEQDGQPIGVTGIRKICTIRMQ